MNENTKAVDVLAVMARRQHGPEVDQDTGADRGSCCEHAWADGWNDCIGNLAEARAAIAELIRETTLMLEASPATASERKYYEARVRAALSRIAGVK